MRLRLRTRLLLVGMGVLIGRLRCNGFQKSIEY